MKLKHVDELSGGRIRFRRRWPKDVAEARGEAYLQRSLVARYGPAMIAEHASLIAEFETVVAEARKSEEERNRMSPRERWQEAQQEADRLLSGGTGEEEHKREIVVEGLAENDGDALLYRAVTQPDAEPPAPTLSDSWAVYDKERLTGAQGRNAKNRLERVRKRTEEALGNLSEIPLEGMKRQHGRLLRDHLNSARTSTNKPLSP